MGQFVSQSKTLKGVLRAVESRVPLFRWFKFTLKPPYSITHDNLRLAIWDYPFRLFGTNLDTRDLETYLRTYSGHF